MTDARRYAFESLAQSQRTGARSASRSHEHAAEALPLPPLFLRVDEAAQILRISRTAAYELAHQWIASGGAAGMPAIRVGRMIRVPVPAFSEWANIDDLQGVNPALQRRTV